MTAAESRTAARNQTSDAVSAAANRADDRFHTFPENPRVSLARVLTAVGYVK